VRAQIQAIHRVERLEANVLPLGSEVGSAVSAVVDARQEHFVVFSWWECLATPKVVAAAVEGSFLFEHHFWVVALVPSLYLAVVHFASCVGHW